MYRRAIIFDMDGLMVDTEPLAREAWAAIVRQHGQTLSDAVYRQMIGRRTVESAQLLLDQYDLPYTAVDLAARKNELFAIRRAQGVPPMPGLEDLMTAVTRFGVPWAVATSSPRSHALAILAQLGLQDACGAIAAGDEVAHGKPAPDIYLLAAQRLGVHPAHCLALEDSSPGCRAAVAAGMKTVAVPNGDTDGADFSFVQAVFASLGDVADELAGLLSD
ncbi:MAG: HAD family phosphatase [Anaerolineales bacterium]|nr:HAD family phosphatase [Anaerolineales bacterium]